MHVHHRPAVDAAVGAEDAVEGAVDRQEAAQEAVVEAEAAVVEEADVEASVRNRTPPISTPYTHYLYIIFHPTTY